MCPKNNNTNELTAGLQQLLAAHAPSAMLLTQMQQNILQQAPGLDWFTVYRTYARQYNQITKSVYAQFPYLAPPFGL